LGETRVPVRKPYKERADKALGIGWSPDVRRNSRVLAIVVLALAGCGNVPLARPGAAAKAPTAISARTVVPAFTEGVLADGGALMREFELPAGGEVLAEFQLAAPGTDWEVSGREAATVRVSLDGTHNQDVVVYRGETPHPYQVALGNLAAGPHVLRFERLAAFSAPQAAAIQLLGGSLGVVPPGAPGYDVLARCPILLGRSSSHKTDTPLVMMVDEAPRAAGGTVTRYTAVYSNEDGGTATPALMARWGRTCDIDWAYAIETDVVGKPVAETYQAMLHFTRSFKGKYEGRHPILRVATNNNCYDDEGDGPLKFRLPPLFRLEPAQTAREEVLDRHPWTYGIMAKELFRERKAQRDLSPSDGPVAPSEKKGPIGDPRRFLFVEFKQAHRGRGVGVSVKLKGLNQAFVSHHGDAGLTAERTGWCRVAVELPKPITLGEIEALDLVGLGRGTAVVTGVRRVLTLDAAFMPVIHPITWVGDQTLAADSDRVRFYEAAVAGASQP